MGVLVSQYVFDNAAVQAVQRFTSLESLYDERTIRFLKATGVGPGWNCLEIGAGGGSIAAWLADCAGANGHVTVTDINPSHLSGLAAAELSNLKILIHDIGVDSLPASAFDLIHARLVLVHVPQRAEALSRLVGALKPGGWIVVEDFVQGFIDRGFPASDPERYKYFARTLAAMEQVMRSHGLDPAWGTSLYRRFNDLGLVEVGHEGHFAAWPGGSQGARLFQANFEQVRAEVVAAGLATGAEVDHAIAELSSPDFAFSSPVMMTAWGRKP
jgi:2-polyprenyl-3-methyl-5-hydroxy-6-metoxy-1,4-benzoquinol methylase